MNFTLLGIPNCDRVRKARKLMKARGTSFHFRDIRETPLSAEEWLNLIDQDHQNLLINTRSPSYRKTGHTAKALGRDAKLEVLLAQPTAMKRPVLTFGEKLLACGFDPEKEPQLLDTLPQ